MGRLDLVRYSSLDLLDPAAVRRSETRTIASPKLGARYLLSNRGALLGNLSRGFRGAVGVIGPTRLNYGRIVPIVDYTAQLVGRLVSDRGKG